MKMLDDYRLYRQYQKWCREEGSTPLSFRKFTKDLDGIFRELHAHSPENEEAFNVAVRKVSEAKLKAPRS